MLSPKLMLAMLVLSAFFNAMAHQHDKGINPPCPVIPQPEQCVPKNCNCTQEHGDHKKQGNCCKDFHCE